MHRNLTIGLICAALLTVAHPGLSQEADGVAPHRITVQIVPGIQSSLELPTPELVNARKALAAGRPILTSDLRAMADMGDGFSALRFAQWLETQENAQSRDLAHYYGIAAATGRGGAIGNMIIALERIPPENLGPVRRKVMRDILLAYARAGNTLAIDALFQFHTQGTPFGSLENELLEIAGQVQGETAAELSLKTAVMLLDKPAPSETDLERTAALLETAMNAETLTTRLTAQNLLPLMESLRAEPSAMEVTQ